MVAFTNGYNPDILTNEDHRWIRCHRNDFIEIYRDPQGPIRSLTMTQIGDLEFKVATQNRRLESYLQTRAGAAIPAKMGCVYLRNYTRAGVMLEKLAWSLNVRHHEVLFAIIIERRRRATEQEREEEIRMEGSTLDEID